MSAARVLDIDAIMRDVRAAAAKRYPATPATLLQNTPQRSNVAAVASQHEPEIEERAGLADSVPAVYLDAWARLNCQKPVGVTEAEWQRALQDGGLFLDQFGKEAAALGWTPRELFAIATGIVWRLAGELVVGVGSYRVLLPHGRSIERKA